MPPDPTDLKKRAAERAVEAVRSGMIVGLGHGSTAMWAIRRIGELHRSGDLRDVFGIACSIETENEAKKQGIPLTTLMQRPAIDLTIDGADEVDPNLDLIKGGGGAFLREKIVAEASRAEIIIVDESKCSPVLGTRCALPVEVVPFGWRSHVEFLESLGARVTLRKRDDNRPVETDQGNLILDCKFDGIPQPADLAAKIKSRTGIVEHGLFLGLATEVIVAGADGIRRLERS